jgi:hypothetical protein
MRYSYWTIQARPDSMRLLSFGIGVLVVEENSQDFRLQMIDRPEAMPNNADNREAIFKISRFIINKFESTRRNLGGIEFSPEDSPSELANHMVANWNNAVTFDLPRTVTAASLNEATDLVFNLYIGNKRDKSAEYPITRLRKSVWSSYEAVPKIRECLHPKPTLQVGELSGSFDFAVVRKDRQVVELNSSFTFTAKKSTTTQSSIELWNYRVTEIRHNGGVLTMGEDTMNLDQNAPIVVTYRPPNSDQQQELFDQISRQWRSFEVQAVPEGQLSDHVEKVEAQLLSA